MKKILCVTLVLSLLCAFAACGKKAEPVNTEEVTDAAEETAETVDLAAVLEAIAEKVEMPAESLDVPVSELKERYGIDAADVASCAIRMDASGYKDEIIMIEAVDEAAAAGIEEALNSHLEYNKKTMRTYAPDRFEILEESSVMKTGNFVSLFVSENADDMIDIYNGFIK